MNPEDAGYGRKHNKHIQVLGHGFVQVLAALDLGSSSLSPMLVEYVFNETVSEDYRPMNEPLTSSVSSLS